MHANGGDSGVQKLMLALGSVQALYPEGIEDSLSQYDREGI